MAARRTERGAVLVPVGQRRALHPAAEALKASERPGRCPRVTAFPALVGPGTACESPRTPYTSGAKKYPALVD